MNHPDESIDKVLAGLGRAEPSSGMEHRILQSLDEEGVRRHSFWSRWSILPGSRIPVFALQGAVVAALLIAGSFFFLHRNPSSPSRADIHPATMRTSDQKETASLPLEVPVAQSVHRTVYHPGKSARVLPASSRQVNIPAPPEPLTQQEKLLLQIAQVGNPEQIAMLDPESRAREKAQREAEFQKFFASNDITQD